MKTVLAFVALMVVVACGPVTLNPAKREFWLGGTDDKQARELAAGRLPAEIDFAEKTRDSYLACMEAYGGAHATAKATAMEIASAAASACSDPLNNFRAAVRVTFRDEWIRSYMAAEPALLADSVSFSRTDQAVTALAEKGRDAAVRAVIEKRPPAPR